MKFDMLRFVQNLIDFVCIDFTSFHKCAILWAVNLLHMYIFHN